MKIQRWQQGLGPGLQSQEAAIPGGRACWAQDSAHAGSSREACPSAAQAGLGAAFPDPRWLPGALPALRLVQPRTFLPRWLENVRDQRSAAAVLGTAALPHGSPGGRWGLSANLSRSVHLGPPILPGRGVGSHSGWTVRGLEVLQREEGCTLPPPPRARSGLFRPVLRGRIGRRAAPQQDLALSPQRAACHSALLCTFTTGRPQTQLAPAYVSVPGERPSPVTAIHQPRLAEPLLAVSCHLCPCATASLPPVRCTLRPAESLLWTLGSCSAHGSSGPGTPIFPRWLTEAQGAGTALRLGAGGRKAGHNEALPPGHREPGDEPQRESPFAYQGDSDNRCHQASRGVQ